MQFACAIMWSVACLAVAYFSTLSHKPHDFRKNRHCISAECFDFLYNICVEHFCTTFVWNISLSNTNTARYSINVRTLGFVVNFTLTEDWQHCYVRDRFVSHTAQWLNRFVSVPAGRQTDALRWSGRQTMLISIPTPPYFYPTNQLLSLNATVFFAQLFRNMYCI